MTDDDGRIGHALVMVSDVTERKAADHALRIAEQQYRTAFDSAPVGMAQLALTGEFQAVNHALCEMIGYDGARAVRAELQSGHPPRCARADHGDADIHDCQRSGDLVG